MSKRSKISILIGMAVVLLFVMSGCGSKEQTADVKPTETAKSSPANTANPANASAKPKEPAPESKLSEISNFMISSFWNEGFVDITWYVSNGTGNTGKKLDIDFTMERLGKAMEQKAEYDTYIQGLDAKYDNVKQVWTKLSKETDNLYKQLKENTPKANDKSYKFDTGLFEQYSSAFRDDVRALNKKQ
ncbi:hypothetical protein YDYSY3_47230 [Paenibacillus chitinolyticus]|uniref:hypothetical protein n=1 Tax=Paenibacillus chitinolyticus TaxID=79263 RepID=UPI0026E4D468|nr:hypothetical protein [Paenibacillus chitinolyticus]GKS13723.1 hypothetical protein YDYSY3_47230 [Paenibacillus chitinolyticus]